MPDHAPRHPDFERAVEEGFRRQGLMATLGAHLVSVSPGACIIEAPIRPEVSQQQGLAHAALAFALGDSAAGFSALTLMDAGQDVVTAEMKIQLMAPAAGAALIAEGRVLRAGRRLVVAASSVYAIPQGGARVHVAELLGTMVPVEVKDR